MKVFILITLNIISIKNDVIFSSTSSPLRSGVPFIGQYVGDSTDTLAWVSPATCSQTKIANTTEQFVCVEKVAVNIGLSIGSSYTSHSLNIVESSECYLWNMENSASKIQIMVNNKSGIPSTDISYQFFVLGEMPKVFLLCDKETKQLPRPIFSDDSKSWEYSLPQDVGHCTTVEVRGIPASLNGCTVRDSLLPFYSNVSFPVAADKVATTSKTKVCKDYCGSGVTVLLNTSHVLVSNDGMNTASLLNIDEVVEDCGVTLGGGIFLLVNGGNSLIIIKDSSLSTIELSFQAEEVDDTMSVYFSLSLPEEGDCLAHIAVNSKCIGIMEEMHVSSPVIVWNDSKMSIIQGSQVTANVTELPELMDSIEAVAISYFGIMVILSNGSSTLWLQYNVQTSFSNGIEISSSCGGDCFLYAICAHINLLVKSSSLFFVTTNGRSLAPVTSHADGEPLAISVKDIAISPDDEWAALSLDNTLYYGFCSRSSAVQIGVGFESAESLIFDNIGDLFFINNVGLKTLIPSEILIGNALGSDSCSLKEFKSTLSSSLVHLDNGEDYKYNLSLNSGNFRYPRILYQLYPQEYATANISSIVSASDLVYGENILSQNIAIAGKSNVGVTVVIATPQSGKPSCQHANSDVTYVVVDCPKTRNLRILDKPTSCKEYDKMPMEYTIPSYYNNEGKEKTVEHSMDQLGCPIIWPYDIYFIPNVWIFDGDVPIRQLGHDFVIRELNDRHDFNYTLSSSHAGCRVNPQNWESMGVDWAFQSYRNCFTDYVDSVALTNGNSQYEILNSTRRNMITFKLHKANYSFELTVVDPQASYCKLQTKFSVWIVDAPSSSDLGMIVLFVSFVVSLVILGLTYYQYRKPTLIKTNQVLQS